MLKKQTLSLLFSLALSSSIVCTASTEAQTSVQASRPVRIAKSTASLMGYTGLTLCSGVAAYICGAIGSDKGLNPLGIIGLVPSCYGLWGGARGMLSSIKEIARACQANQACNAAYSSNNPITT